ncbi:MAG: NADH-quinone oxidoreductase subunit J [Puniceicoccaceae bacterium]|nr:MAG: NADH-quinone oxidoreductase subunit J [Puniceicoccaceae bacterium]
MNLTASGLLFFAFAVLTLGAGTAVALVREPVRAALVGALCFVGVGLLYLWLGAEFLGFIQWLVYVGAVAVLIVFVILLTRREDAGGETEGGRFAGLRVLGGLGVALALFGALAAAVLGSGSLYREVPEEPMVLEIAALGRELVAGAVPPLILVGVVLTVALVGGVTLALVERKPDA